MWRERGACCLAEIGRQGERRVRGSLRWRQRWGGGLAYSTYPYPPPHHRLGEGPEEHRDSESRGESVVESTGRSLTLRTGGGGEDVRYPVKVFLFFFYHFLEKYLLQTRRLGGEACVREQTRLFQRGLFGVTTRWPRPVGLLWLN